MRYPFFFDGGENNVYAFETDLGISYEVKFRPSSYLLGNETTPFANHIYEFIIEIVYNPLGKNPPLDKLISKTISGIDKDFYRPTKTYIFLNHQKLGDYLPEHHKIKFYQQKDNF